MDGLHFRHARYLVADCLKNSIEGPCLKSRPVNSFVYYLVFLPSIISILLSAIVYSVPYLNDGVLVTIVIIVTVVAFNIWLSLRFSASFDNEIRNYLLRIYEEFAIHSRLNETSDTNAKNHEESGIITAGHPHISMVTCFRNRQWLRIPSLLLAEGDIIALQAGDIAPGDCFELSCTQVSSVKKGTGADVRARNNSSARISKGSKVFKKQFINFHQDTNRGQIPHITSAISYERHRYCGQSQVFSTK